jgi:hypothetical protein
MKGLVAINNDIHLQHKLRHEQRIIPHGIQWFSAITLRWHEIEIVHSEDGYWPLHIVDSW